MNDAFRYPADLRCGVATFCEQVLLFKHCDTRESCTQVEFATTVPVNALTVENTSELSLLYNDARQ